jgi:hypothetical protein
MELVQGNTTAALGKDRSGTGCRRGVPGSFRYGAVISGFQCTAAMKGLEFVMKVDPCLWRQIRKCGGELYPIDHARRLALAKRGREVVSREFSYHKFASTVHREVERALGKKFCK